MEYPFQGRAGAEYAGLQREETSFILRASRATLGADSAGPSSFPGSQLCLTLAGISYTCIILTNSLLSFYVVLSEFPVLHPNKFQDLTESSLRRGAPCIVFIVVFLIP